MSEMERKPYKRGSGRKSKHEAGICAKEMTVYADFDEGSPSPKVELKRSYAQLSLPDLDFDCGQSLCNEKEDNGRLILLHE